MMYARLLEPFVNLGVSLTKEQIDREKPAVTISR